MYFPSKHAETSLKVLRQVVRENPLGMFTTAISSTSHPLIQSSHIPFLLDVEDESSETELGRLRCHVARANPQSKAIIESVESKLAAGISPSNTLEHDVLVIFTSPVHHYITPKFYTETKPSTGKVVPTWNYSAVEIYGKATVYVDTKSDETSNFLNQQIHDLSQFNETQTMGYTGQGDRQGPWKVTDAPERYVELLKKAIIGVEIKIEKMQGKFKMSQEMPDGDVEGVKQGFRAMGTDLGNKIADITETRKEILEEKKKSKQ